MGFVDIWKMERHLPFAEASKDGDYEESCVCATVQVIKHRSLRRPSLLSWNPEVFMLLAQSFHDSAS